MGYFSLNAMIFFTFPTKSMGLWSSRPLVLTMGPQCFIAYQLVAWPSCSVTKLSGSCYGWLSKNCHEFHMKNLNLKLKYIYNAFWRYHAHGIFDWRQFWNIKKYDSSLHNNKLSKLPNGRAMNWQHDEFAGNKVLYTVDNCFLMMHAIPYWFLYQFPENNVILSGSLLFMIIYNLGIFFHLLSLYFQLTL